MPAITPLYQCQCFNTHCYHCFVNGLKRDKARGQLAPHQLILLLALLADVNKQGSRIAEPEYAVITDIRQLNDYFQSVWKQHRHHFSSTNPKIGLPLQSFSNQGLIVPLMTFVVLKN
jgi:hypothetical protein